MEEKIGAQSRYLALSGQLKKNQTKINTHICRDVLNEIVTQHLNLLHN